LMFQHLTCGTGVDIPTFNLRHLCWYSNVEHAALVLMFQHLTCGTCVDVQTSNCSSHRRLYSVKPTWIVYDKMSRSIMSSVWLLMRRHRLNTSWRRLKLSDVI